MSTVHFLHQQTSLVKLRKLVDVCAWAKAHLHEPISWRTLIARSELSHEELHDLFIEQMGIGPMAWIRVQREALLCKAASSGVDIPDAEAPHDKTGTCA